MKGNFRRAHARWLGGFVCALRLFFDADLAAADAACTVRFVPPELAGEWRRAGLEVARRVPNWPKPDRDCRELVIQVATD